MMASARAPSGAVTESLPAPHPPFVQTALGPVDPAILGPTLMHEHLVWDYGAAVGVAPRVETIWPLERILERLARAEELGVRCVVDVTPEQLGPHPLIYPLIALQTGVHIVCATGYYCADVVPAPRGARSLHPPDCRRIADQFVAVATHGLEATGVKPGIVKVSTSGRAVLDIEEAALRGAAAAQRQTGLAITTHTQATRFAEEQVEILLDGGADLDRVVIGHIGWGSGAGDFIRHERLARSGVTLGLDLIGTPARSDAEYSRIALDLIEAGYASQIVFSHDNCGWASGFDLYGPELEPGYYSGDFTAVHGRIIPLLVKAGVKEDILQTILIDTPRRLLTIDPNRYPGALHTLLSKPPETDVRRAGDAGAGGAVKHPA